MNDTNFGKTAEQAAALQKSWMESMSKVMQAAFTFTPDSPPPEVMRQIRSSIFQALAESWEEFMRSPRFLESMKQGMDHTTTLRKTTNDFLAKTRNDLQAPSRDDMDNVMLSVRHMEKRLLDRLEELSTQVSELNERLAGQSAKRPATAAAGGKSPGVAAKPTPPNGKPASI